MALLPNQDDVQYTSGNLGYSKLFANEIPANVVKNESGNSSIVFSNRGARLDLSSTAGETVGLTLGEWALGPFSHAILDGFFVPTDAPFSHNIAVGMFASVTGTDGYQWNLANGELVVGSRTATVPVTPSAYDRIYFRFDIDGDVGETTLSVTIGDSATEEVTVQNISPFFRPKIMAGETVSNGSGSITLQNMRLSLVR